MTDFRVETDSLGEVRVPADKLWGAQTQRSLEHFSIGKDLMPREMISAYATLKKAAAIANRDGKRLDDQRYKLIVQAASVRRAAMTLLTDQARLTHRQQCPPLVAARHREGRRSIATTSVSTSSTPRATSTTTRPAVSTSPRTRPSSARTSRSAAVQRPRLSTSGR